MATSIITLLEEIIESIRDTDTITSITNSGTTYTINTANTHRLVVGDYIKINSIEYKITSLTVNTRFTVTSTSAITGTTWTASAPYFYYGTVQYISNSLDKITDYQNKFPVIVLFETMPADVNDNNTSTIERTIDCEMYFMDESDYVNFTSDEYYTQVINPIQLYVDSFIEALKVHAQIGELDRHNETPYSVWNMIRLSTGKNVFNANLSGIGLRINIPIKILPRTNCS
ncbi:MAG: hypothetical protein WC390_07305 [Sulfurimonas sp.]|jgi:hypothetical protein